MDQEEALPDEYKDAFAEVAGPDKAVSEDDAMGISTPAEESAVAAVEASEAPAEAASEGAESTQVQQEGIQNSAAENTPHEPAPGPADGEGEEVVSEKELQRRRTYEGRMRKLEENLQALADQSKSKQDTATDQLAAAVDSQAPGDTLAADVVAQLEDGSLSPDAAMRQLEEDFGPDFVKMISVVVANKAAEIAGKTVADVVKPMTEEVKQITSAIADEKERKHFETIASAVPDFFEQVKTPAFTQFLEKADEATKRIAANGTAKEVISMMKSFTAANAPAEPVAKPKDDPALAAAEGVRSGSVRLPDKPGAAANDFEAAWAEA